MSPLSKTARIAGLLYLLLVLIGPIRLIYIPNTLFVTGDAAATAANMTAHESLFRLGMVTSLFCAALLVYVTSALYRLFETVDRERSVQVVILGGIMPAVMFFMNVVNDAAALMLVRGGDYLSVFGQPQREALAFLFLRLHHQTDVAAEVLWGLWLLPLASLAWRSGFIPKLLAVWLMVAGLSYLALSFTAEMLPQFEDRVFRIGSPARIGELAFGLWLLIMGAKARRA